MGKLAIIFSLGVLICVVEQSVGMGTYYWTYPGAQAGALTYPGAQAGPLTYPAPVPYQQFQQFSPYALLPVDCDENKVVPDGGESGSSSSSSSSSSESAEGESEESSSSSSEEGKPAEEGEASGELKEAVEAEGSEGSSEGSSSEESSESSESGSSSESKSKEEEKKKKKEEKPKSLFPPVQYTTFPARPVQQYVYSAPLNQYLPLRTYSVIQQQPSYPVKSINQIYSVPAAAGYNAPVLSGAMNGPSVVKSYSPVPVTRFMSSSLTRVVQSPIQYAVPASSYTYWNPSSNLGYFKK